jgi:hypothetical protein
VSTAAIIGGSLAGAGISAGTSLSAAGTQASAAEQAQQLQAQEAQNSLNFQEQEWNTQQANEAPWLQAGKGALNNLQGILASPGQGWNQTFTPPTAAQAEQYPGYQFQEQQGEGALQNSAAAKGALYSGNTQEALAQYGQQSAQSDYTNVYNQAFQQYQQGYGEYQNQLNRLSALAGTGQTAATTLGSEGQAAASNIGNTYLTTGAQQGQDIQNAGAATASGYVGAGNALSGGISSIPNLLMLQQMLGQSSAPGTVAYPGQVPTGGINATGNPNDPYDI